jgi:tetratricopeptide (TPR) repeat protein
MKTTERHRLKENELAYALDHGLDVLGTNRSRAFAIIGLAVIVGGALGGYLLWRARTNANAAALLGGAMTIMEAPVTQPPPAPAAGQPAPPPPAPQPGAYASQKVKLEAALATFVAAAESYPKTKAGILARYQAASVLATLSRPDEAAKRFQEVMDLAGQGSVYYEMARLGKVSVEAHARRFDEAIKTYTDLSNNKDGTVPPDAMLMQLGRTYLMAGKTQEARTAFRRLLDEYPASPFAADAKREVDQLTETS